MKKYQAPIVGENEYLLNSKANVTFDEILRMSEKGFDKWAKLLAKEIKFAWDKYGTPPRPGIAKDKIVTQFKALSNLDVASFLQRDELTYDYDCIINKTANLGSACLAFFPNIDKTKDLNASGNNLEGMSIYDIFSKPKYSSGMRQMLHRSIRKDSFFKFSPVVKRNNPSFLVKAATGKKWIKNYLAQHSAPFIHYGFWIDINQSKGKSTKDKFLSLSKNDIDELLSAKLISKAHFPNGSIKDIKTGTRCKIRFYKRGQKILPKAYSCFQTAWVMSGSNFPPPIVKFLYKHFTEKIKAQKKLVVYDPSSGFGGRILGALALNNDRKIHYVGTDPNPDNWLGEINKSRYEYMADFFNSNVKGKHKTTVDIFTVGSEVIHRERKFQKYKGKIDLIFTSPPYFAAEGYSEDENQSFKKFPTYLEWRDGFLKKTLETCYKYLKKKRWLLFNIADIKFGAKYYPLEKDTIEICKTLGFEYRIKMKMVLSASPGANKVNKITRLPTTKNFCQVNGSRRKYEPIFCFWKK